MAPIFSDPAFIALASGAFWLFITIVAVVAMLTNHKKNKAMQETLRMAIEKGVELDPAVIDSLNSHGPEKPEPYFIGGFAATGTGLGLPILGYFLGKIAPAAFYPLVGAGVLVILIGLSLIGVAMLLDKREKEFRDRTKQA